ncbi:acetyl-CoA carboxylase biotin carboxylase subunit [Philodulcilactobacillus myokoensis]|uniref:biotin carboxylase n=1 Tax=Philodulcilactobacillus myokoensis TaxID=2929573 RepID=A0A9W6ESG8_9LACO|nr:acetyl-CoA carboxylase biotin carboxylase subunit [Philodulcilactobacillus myokoensis]GLB46477.1 acetyl-CoA carboxylase biotin carboxylase subunit [Philodulcilactobacillus myokoensis]
MFKKVLIANRGEIAVQIIRSLHEMNIKAVAVYSTADRDSMFVKMADEAYCIGGPFPSESYLNMAAIIDTACLSGCDAIHPGYGFLSENAEFSHLCADCHIKFIGPDYRSIELMGNKANAKETMKKNHVPTIPGSDGVLKSLDDALNHAHRIGYPVMIKASAGGGGKGIRRANNDEELKNAYNTSYQEAKLDFDDGSLYMEKDLSHAKHVEMQFIADQFGHAVYFPERDCSLQRNHQKVLEESPCSAVSPEQRKHMGELISHAVKEIGYENTGTFEFLMKNNHFYFMEMNARLQVEHTITEEVANVELIKAQILVAEGEPLPFKQSDIQDNSYAVECRINAEDPAHNFMPSPGKIKNANFAFGTKGVRIDSGVKDGSVISPYYDSMIAKIIVHMPNKKSAVNKMKRVIKEFKIDGVKTNRQFLYDLLNDKQFNSGNFDNMYIETNFLKEWLKKVE